MTSKYHDELLRLLEAVKMAPDQSPPWQTAMEALVQFLTHHLVARMQVTCNRQIPQHELETMAREVLYRPEPGSGLIPRMLALHPDVTMQYLRITADRKVIDYYNRQSRFKSINQFEEDHDLGIRRNPLDRISMDEWEAEEPENQLREHQTHLYREALKALSETERRLLDARLVEHKSISELAEEDLVLHPLMLKGSRAGEPRTIDEARDAVDQRLTRIRQKLRLEVKKMESSSPKGGES